jgi:hypothetical protein
MKKVVKLIKDLTGGTPHFDGEQQVLTGKNGPSVGIGFVRPVPF